MKLYQAVTSPFAVRVRIALYAKGVDMEFVVPPGGLGSDEFRKITPLGKVPTLVCDDGSILAESAVINEYLEERVPEPSLFPAGAEERARARMVVQMTADSARIEPSSHTRVGTFPSGEIFRTSSDPSPPGAATNSTSTPFA